MPSELGNPTRGAEGVPRIPMGASAPLALLRFAVALVVGPRSHPIEVRSGCTYLKILGLSVGIVGGMVLDYRFGLTPQLNQTRATPSVSLPTSRVFQSALRARELPEHRSEICQLNE